MSFETQHSAEGLIRGERKPNVVIKMEWGSKNTHVYIPAPVYEIEMKAFHQGGQKVQSVLLPDTLKKIGMEAFADCPDLQSLLVLDEEYCISDGAKRDLPEKLKQRIRNGEEPWIKGLFLLPNGMKEIGMEAFRDCTSLRYIYLPDGLKKLGRGVLAGCDALESFRLPPGIRDVPFEACANCISLTEVKLHSKTKVIEGQAFENCRSLREINIPDSVRRIGVAAFKGCSNLRSVKLPAGVDYICAESFQDCISLRSIEIPNKVYEIGKAAFAGCRRLYKFRLPRIDKISERCFEGCEWLLDIQLPDSLRKIEKGAFRNCKRLKRIVLPAKLKSIGAGAFEGCDALQEVVLPERAITLEPGAFPDHVRILTSRVQAVQAKAEAPVVEGGAEFKISGSVLMRYEGRDARVAIPKGVERIAPGAFQGNAHLEQLIVPESLREIGDGAFEGCTGLAEVEFPKEGLEWIGERAFYGCTSIKSMELPRTVREIESYAFAGCTGAEKLYLPPEIKRVSLGVFENCESLLYAAIPQNVAEIEPFAFQGCKALKMLLVLHEGKGNGVELLSTFDIHYKFRVDDIPGLHTIGDAAFADCEELGTVEGLPGSLRRIGRKAFAGCNGILSVSLSLGIQKIGNSAFRDCKNLKEVWLPETFKCDRDSFWPEGMFAGCTALDRKKIHYGPLHRLTGSSVDLTPFVF